MAAALMATAVQLQLRLDTFEGPLELLLLLIEQRKLPITQVSLAQVADQYLAQVHAAPELDPDLLADFLAIAGKLLLLKSRALLLTEEHDPEVEQVATDLTERLAEYRVFRAAAEALRELEQRGGRTYPATRPPMVTSVPAPLTPVGAEALVAGVAPTPQRANRRPRRSAGYLARQRRRTPRAGARRAADRRQRVVPCRGGARRSTRSWPRFWRCWSCFGAAESASIRTAHLPTSC